MSELLFDFAKELDELKESLQSSLAKFREVRRKLRELDSKEDIFLYRRLSQLESQHLRDFESDRSRMNLLIEHRILHTEKLVDEIKDTETVTELRKRLKLLQNSFDAHSPAIGLALEKVTKRSALLDT